MSFPKSHDGIQRGQSVEERLRKIMRSCLVA